MFKEKEKKKEGGCLKEDFNFYIGKVNFYFTSSCLYLSIKASPSLSL